MSSTYDDFTANNNTAAYNNASADTSSPFQN